MWVSRLSIVDWVFFKTQILLVTLRTENQPRVKFLCILGSRTFVTISWMCKKQTSVSHRSAESEIMSLETELRLDGLLALDLWDMVIEVLRSTNNTARQSRLAQGDLCATGDHSINKNMTNQLERESERMSSCQLWITYPPTHLSCTFLKTTKQSST